MIEFIAWLGQAYRKFSLPAQMCLLSFLQSAHRFSMVHLQPGFQI